MTTSHLTVDVSYITSGASIAKLKEVATAAAPIDTTSVDSNDRVLNGRDNTVTSSMWCPRLTLPVSGNVTMPLTTVGLNIALPATYYASIGAATLEQMQEAAFAVQQRLSAAVGDTADVATALASFRSAWAACTGLPPAAAEKAVAIVRESVAIVPGQPEDAALTSQALSSRVRAPPSTRMAVAISHPPQRFHVASGGSLSVSWTFPQGDCSSADTVSILLFSVAQSLNRVDSHGPPVTALAESTWPCAGSSSWTVTIPSGTPAGPHIIAVAASGPGNRDTAWRAPQMATVIIFVESPSPIAYT